LVDFSGNKFDWGERAASFPSLARARGDAYQAEKNFFEGLRRHGLHLTQPRQSGLRDPLATPRGRVQTPGSPCWASRHLGCAWSAIAPKIAPEGRRASCGKHPAVAWVNYAGMPSRTSTMRLPGNYLCPRGRAGSIFTFGGHRQGGYERLGRKKIKKSGR